MPVTKMDFFGHLLFSSSAFYDNSLLAALPAAQRRKAPVLKLLRGRF